jgi:TATA-binding protein-associated factor Taf7
VISFFRLSVLCIFGLVFGSIAQSQEYGAIDFELLFRIHADKIEIVPNSDASIQSTQELVLPGPVVVRKVWRGSRAVYISTDQSKYGAVGCYLGIVVEMQVAIDRCPKFGTKQQQQSLLETLIRVSKFYAQNTVPVVDPQLFLKKLNEGRQVKLRASTMSAQSCQAILENTKAVQFLNAFTDEKAQKWLDGSLATPRLPVINPCF